MSDVVLPWPHKGLSPNARVHHFELARLKKEARQTAWALCKEARFPGTRHLHITFHPPCNRRRDLDNCLASVKAQLDGIADATGVDDAEWSLTITMGGKVDGGKVIVSDLPNAERARQADEIARMRGAS